MARPTEPGYYWLNRGAWHIVEVSSWIQGAEAFVYTYCGGEEQFLVKNTADSQWGGRITQEPAPDPPPPF